MSTYNGSAVSDAVIAFRKPITLQQGRALRDNPLAVAEGAVGAPYVEATWHPYDSLAVGDGGTGELWSFGTDGAVASIETPDFVDGYEYRLRFDAVSVSSTGIDQAITLSLYRETTGAYASLGQITAEVHHVLLLCGDCQILRPRATELAHVTTTQSVTGGSNTVVTPTLSNYTIAHATAQKILKARLAWSGGNFDAGAVYLDKRRVYA